MDMVDRRICYGVVILVIGVFCALSLSAKPVCSIPVSSYSLSDIADPGVYRYDCLFTLNSVYLHRYTLDFYHYLQLNNTPEFEMDFVLHVNSQYVDTKRHFFDSFTTISQSGGTSFLLPRKYLVDGQNNVSITLVFFFDELDTLQHGGTVSFSALNVTRRNALYVR